MLINKFHIFLTVLFVPAICGLTFEDIVTVIKLLIFSNWSYRTADDWKNTYPSCGGSEQSPINIDVKEFVENSKGLLPIKYSNYDNVPKKMTLKNNGRGVELHAEWADGETPYISGGSLEDDYLFDFINFHWGPTDESGSEHTIEGSSYPLEMHIVHTKKSYGPEIVAFLHSDGGAVIGRLFKLSADKNFGFDSFIHYVSNITEPYNEVEVDPFPLTNFNFKLTNESVVTYSGSVSYPPCFEIVTYFLPTTELYVMHETLYFFRAIKLLNDDDHTNRPTQPINKREPMLLKPEA